MIELINDVALLDSQLKQAGCPCDENLYVHLSQGLDLKPLARRLKLWRFRKELSQKIVAPLLSHSALSALTHTYDFAASRGTAAMSPRVFEKETKRKRKLDEPPNEGDACPCADGIDPYIPVLGVIAVPAFQESPRSI
jgi:hypothetical protein